MSAPETKPLIGKVVLPERRPVPSWQRNSHDLGDARDQGFNDCLDQIKVEPMSVDELLPTEAELALKLKNLYLPMLRDMISRTEAYNCAVEIIDIIHEHLRKKLCGEKGVG